MSADQGAEHAQKLLRGNGPVVLITGCSSGLGRALAVALHTHASGRYRVVATARRVAAMEDLAAAGIRCLAMDVTSDASVRAAVGEVVSECGRVDVVINNAGLSRIGPLLEQPLEEVQAVLDTNFLGALRVTQAAVPGMVQRCSGLVVMVGSVVSQMATPWSAAYTASKAALLGATDALRLELLPFGVGVTYVMAGSIKSSLADNTNASCEFATYEGRDSVYRPYAASIRARANASQDLRTIMTAEATAARIVAVIDRAVGPPGRTPPIWFFAGGKAFAFWAVGMVQKVLGWPINGMLAKKFGLLPPL